ncbi:AAA family ATPase [Bacteroides sp.]|mgnify:FL=1|uniref:AAA family ATPase n=1 Tax=Bacteroides sp. TaxID=29523 RepID=UPI00402870FA
MIINFTVGNYRSFKDKKVLSMEATAIKELHESVIEKEGYRLLPSAVIYGANSSGKSNLLKAIGKFRDIVNSSSKLNSTDKLGITPFLLNQETAKEPSFFEMELLIDNQTYTYGFTADNLKVYEEWLYTKEGKAKKEKCLFVRTEEGIGIADDYNEGKGLEEKVRDNGLFLSTIDSFNGEVAKKIIHKIDSFLVISGINHESWSGFTNDMCNNKNPNLSFKQKIQDFLNSMNAGFNRFELPEDEKLAKEIKAYTIHNLYNEQGEIIGETRFSMKEHESSGTNKLFDLAALVISQLAFGDSLVVDELDSKLHPLLTQHIIKLFNNPETNPKGAQLIFATHDTNLLNVKTFRRDQIWFTEKDHSEATDLYSLAEFREPEGNKIRKDRSFEKDYINGRYGAIPYIKD